MTASLKDAALRRQFTEHLPYEVQMLSRTYEFLQDPPAGTEPWLRNAVIESFAIHARLLGEFFAGGQGGRPDYFTSGGGYPKGAVLSKKQTKQLNIEIAHLSAERQGDRGVQLTSENWDAIFAVLVDELGQFKLALKPEFASAWTVDMERLSRQKGHPLPALTATNAISITKTDF